MSHRKLNRFSPVVSPETSTIYGFYLLLVSGLFFLALLGPVREGGPSPAETPLGFFSEQSLHRVEKLYKNSVATTGQQKSELITRRPTNSLQLFVKCGEIVQVWSFNSTPGGDISLVCLTLSRKYRSLQFLHRPQGAKYELTSVDLRVEKAAKSNIVSQEKRARCI